MKTINLKCINSNLRYIYHFPLVVLLNAKIYKDNKQMKARQRGLLKE